MAGKGSVIIIDDEQSVLEILEQYLIDRGYEVEAVFPDTFTGGGDFMKRPGMVALLSYLDAMPDQSYVVIFDDLKRFASGLSFSGRPDDHSAYAQAHLGPP